MITSLATAAVAAVSLISGEPARKSTWEFTEVRKSTFLKTHVSDKEGVPYAAGLTCEKDLDHFYVLLLKYDASGLTPRQLGATESAFSGILLEADGPSKDEVEVEVGVGVRNDDDWDSGDEVWALNIVERGALRRILQSHKPVTLEVLAQDGWFDVFDRSFILPTEGLAEALPELDRRCAAKFDAPSDDPPGDSDDEDQGEG